MRSRASWDASRHAAQALGERGDRRAVEALCDEVTDIKRLADGYWSVREAAAHALSRLGDPRAVEPLCFLLEHDFATVGRYAAAKALGTFHDSRAIKPLLGALDDFGTSDYPVYYQAALSLGEIGDPSAIGALFDAALKRGWTSFSHLSWGIALGLGSIRDERSVQPLTYFVQKHPDPRVREIAAESLGKLGFAAALPVLREQSGFFREMQGSVRSAIKKAIAAIVNS
jgi:HEAT repeat protein